MSEYIPIFDVRERKSGLIDMLIDTKKPHKVETLLVGDFVISNRTAGEIKRVRKSTDYRYDDYSDLFGSMKNERIYRQAKNLQENYEIKILIIEIEKGASLFNLKFTEKSWQKFQLSMIITYDMHIYITHSNEETIDLIYQIWDKELNPHLPSPSNKNPRPKTLRDKQLYFLSGLEDLGDIRSKELLSIYNTPLNVIAWIISTIITYTKGGNPRKPDNCPDGYGSNFLLKNQKLLTGDIIYADESEEENNNSPIEEI